MNNRVDYLSDKLVNLRGKLKSVEEVVPKDSIVNGVSAPVSKNASATSVRETSSAERAAQALERRREQTCQLHSDYEQRLVRRMRQLEVKKAKLDQTINGINSLISQLELRKNNLEKLRISDSENLSQVELGERFRAIDQERLAFYACDGEIELLLAENNSGSAAEEKAAPAVEDFKTMLKKGWALALSLGVVVGVSAIIAALIVYLGWR